MIQIDLEPLKDEDLDEYRKVRPECTCAPMIEVETFTNRTMRRRGDGPRRTYRALVHADDCPGKTRSF